MGRIKWGPLYMIESQTYAPVRFKENKTVNLFQISHNINQNTLLFEQFTVE